MRVIVANRFYFPDESATSRMVASLATGLARLGHDVYVITGRHYHDRPDRLPASEVLNGVMIRRVWITSSGQGGLWGRALDYLTFHMSVIWRIRQLARRGDAIIACTDPPLLSVTAMIATLGTGAVLINWLHDLYPEAATRLRVLDEKRLAVRALFWLRNASLWWARRNVTPIAGMAELLSAGGHGSFTIIRQWSDGEEIRPVAPENNRLHREWSLQDKFVISYSGNFGRVHDFNTILNAAQRLRERNDIVFLFVGDGPKRHIVEDAVRLRGLDNVVLKPLQPRERLAESLSAADVHLVSLLPELEACCVPSKFYGILAAGRPIVFIGDRRGELGRTLQEAQCGVSVDVGDDTALAQVIATLAASETQCRAMGKRAHQTFEAAFSERIGVGAWNQLLIDIDPRSRLPTRSAPADDVIQAGLGSNE